MVAPLTRDSYDLSSGRLLPRRLEGFSERGVTGMCLMFKKGGHEGESTSLLSCRVIGAVTQMGRRKRGRNGQELLSGSPAESMRGMMAARAQTPAPRLLTV